MKLYNKRYTENLLLIQLFQQYNFLKPVIQTKKLKPILTYKLSMENNK